MTRNHVSSLSARPRLVALLIARAIDGFSVPTKNQAPLPVHPPDPKGPAPIAMFCELPIPSDQTNSTSLDCVDTSSGSNLWWPARTVELSIQSIYSSFYPSDPSLPS